MTRFIIASRKRTDIDLPYYIGSNEFSLVLLSMFNYHGDLLVDSKDKSSVTHGIEKLVGQKEGADINEPIKVNPCPTIQSKQVIISVAMAVVGSVTKNLSMKTVKDFKDTFVSLIITTSEGFDEVRVFLTDILISL